MATNKHFLCQKVWVGLISSNHTHVVKFVGGSKSGTLYGFFHSPMVTFYTVCVKNIIENPRQWSTLVEVRCLSRAVLSSISEHTNSGKKFPRGKSGFNRFHGYINPILFIPP